MATRRRRIRITKVTRKSIRFVQPGTRDVPPAAQDVPAANRAHCPHCGCIVEWIKRVQAVQLLAGGCNLLDGLIENGQVHELQAAAGEELVCRQSLAACLAGRLLNGSPDSVS